MALKYLKLLLILFFGLASGMLYAQKNETIQRKKLIRTIKPSFDIDQRFSFINNAPVNIWGARIGLLFNECFKSGFGAYALSNRLKSKKLDQNGNPFYYAQRDVYFGTWYIEPFLIRKEYWELSIPVEVGYGKSYFKVYNGNNIFLGEEIKPFFPTGSGLSMSVKMPAFFGWKPFRWIGINGLVGYRYSLLSSEFDTNYDGMFWSISITVFFDRVFDDVRYWKNLNRQKK